MRISDWSSDVCSSDLLAVAVDAEEPGIQIRALGGREGAASPDQAVDGPDQLGIALARIVVPDGKIGGVGGNGVARHQIDGDQGKIGRASGRERECQYV